jgi:hypothetical protein
LKILRLAFHTTFGLTMLFAQLLGSCEQTHKARLDSYRALATRSPSNGTQRPHSLDEDRFAQSASAKLAAASLILLREDLIPCASLPPRKLTTANGQEIWLDGSWSNYARPFVVKGSAQSGLCRLEIHPNGTNNLNLGGREAFVRGERIRILMSGPAGDSLFPPSNQGYVKCLQKQNHFEVSYEGLVIGQTSVSYVMNESIPLELNQRVCLARILDSSKKAMPDWVFILPTHEPVASNP